METVFGQSSAVIESDLVKAYVTEQGGHLGPVYFSLGDRAVQPLSVAPWFDEELPDETPAIIKVLRGDFFCMPFGGNGTPFKGEEHPVHGDTANLIWKIEANGSHLEAALDLRVRSGRVKKEICLKDGESVVYIRHRISGMSGPMCYGHHAMLRFPSQGHISTSPFSRGQVLPSIFEEPALGGYSSLQPGATFGSLKSVPAVDGSQADLSQYPAREGFEDLVMVSSDPQSTFAWSAVAFPAEGYVWFSLKNPQSLASTVLWHSNGGRHYPPWNGRHRAVLGVEEVTAFFHYGLAESVAPNAVSAAGIPTYMELTEEAEFVVPYLMGVAAIPSGFGAVKHIERLERGIEIFGESGFVKVAVDTTFLN